MSGKNKKKNTRKKRKLEQEKLRKKALAEHVEKVEEPVILKIEEARKEEIPEEKTVKEATPEGAEVQKKLGRKKKVLLWAGAVSFVAVSAYGAVAWSYRERLLPGTRINEIACGQRTVSDIEAQIKESAEDFRMKVRLRDGEEFLIQPEDINYHYISDGGVEKILEDQNCWMWLPSMFLSRSYEVGEKVDFDREKLYEFVDKLPQVQEENVSKPADAKIIFKEGIFQIEAESEGNQLKTQELKQLLEQAIVEEKEEVSAEEHQLYEVPAIRQDDTLLLAQKDQLNQLATANITYQLPGDETIVINGESLKNWLVQDESGNYYRDEKVFEEKLTSFIREMEKKIDNVGAERTFKSTNYGEYKLAGGSYGWLLNSAKEKETLRQELKNNVVTVREPVYKQKGKNTTENGGIGNTYVEIDMSAQHMWYYKDGVCMLDSDVVTGTMNRSRYTPEGIYYVYFKQRNRILRGRILPSTGKPEYETPVAVWMPFNGGIGLHDADWNSYFGGKKYIYSGSHGCINLPGSVAKKLYNLLDVGTPVICYYPKGYSLR